jgi:alpha-L-arabinofuranosidase
MKSSFAILTTVLIACTHLAKAQDATIEIHAGKTLGNVSRYLTGACIEDVNHEIYGGLYSQMIFGESFQEPGPDVSGSWRSFQAGDAQAAFRLATNNPFVGTQSQRLEFTAGTGMVGIENRGLNRWGLNIGAGKSFEGCVWVRSEHPTECFVALEGEDGKTICAEKQLKVTSADWQRLDFTLKTRAGAHRGRFAIKLKQPGAITVGYVFLQPGSWGRFKGLPVRRDVAEGLIDQGITLLRYGGSMVNAPEYRWKKMIGPRDRRPPYRGTWYKNSSNGWGIIDFLNFCEAAGFLAIPDFNIDETPQDMADFIEYANGPQNSVWGARRAADGHPKPYGLKHLELGNEERVDDTYATKFEALAKAIWPKDPNIVLVVGDFAYQKPITDPFHISGADSRITSLTGQKRILQLARQNNSEVWFDVHVWTEGPKPASSLEGAISFRDALLGLADGAQFSVAIFELNANNHSQRRALANALAIQTFERDGRIPVVASANGLQPDGQNDNGWNQGLLFLNPEHVWLQPPGYVNQMLARNHLPQLIECQSSGATNQLDALATRSDDKKTLVLQVVNSSDKPIETMLKISGFTPRSSIAQVEELSGPLNARNSSSDTKHIQPGFNSWKHALKDGPMMYRFSANSFTVLRFK